MKKLVVPIVLILSLEANALGHRTTRSTAKSPENSRVALNSRRSESSGRRASALLRGSAQETSKNRSANDILKYADSGVGSPYVWGGSRWSPVNRKILGADCSGFAQKSWGYPKVIETNVSLPSNKRLTTSEFIKAQDAGYPWTRLDKTPYDQALPGDAMVYRTSKGGHIFLVSKTDNSGVVTVEARGKKYGIGYARKSYTYLKNKGYKTIRLK
ncbi:MAG: NlpC/P60 family protein [Bdellovibrionota bacterium]